jgi:TolB-like protein/tetratricopeptide (TPR) repeat protein
MSQSDIPNNGAKPGPEGSPLQGKKLDSWGEIASYLDREVRTVQRWEDTESLPVHRHEHKKKSTVYAYTGELDAWMKQRQPKDDPQADIAYDPDPEVVEPDSKSAILDDRSPIQVPVNVPNNPAPLVPAELPPSPVGKRLIIAMFALAIISALSIGLYRWLHSAPATQDSIRLVVLPFDNLSGDSKRDYLSVGLTDVITTQLGRLDPARLRVIAPTSAKVMAGKPIAEIRQKLNVQYILEGSVQPVANQVRIDIRLIQTSDEAQAGSDSFTRELSDFLRVESDVSDAVARKMLATLPVTSQPAVTAATSQPGLVTAEASSKSSEAFLKGEILWTNRGNLKKSADLFEEAIHEDSNNALAYAGLANATALIGQVPNDGMRAQESKPKARDAAQHALKLDPRLAEAHAVLGNVAMSYDWDFATAEREFKTAIDLNPNYTFSREWYAHLLMVEGRFDEALAETSHVLELEPATPLFHVVKAEILYHARRYDEAIGESLSVVKAHPEFVLAYYWLGSSYREKKMYPQAIATFEAAKKITGDMPFVVMAIGHAQAVAGNPQEANRALSLLKQIKQTMLVPDIYPAAIYVGLEDKDQAFHYLNLAYQERVDRLVYLGVEPMADPIRSDPRFAQLMAKIGLRH